MPAKSLKEDFCGTAILSAEWVRTRPDNIAVGVDLHEPTLKWAEENNLAPRRGELLVSFRKYSEIYLNKKENLSKQEHSQKIDEQTRRNLEALGYM